MPRIVEGKPRKEKRRVCEHCGMTIAYVENDVEERSGTDYGGGPDGERFVRCPGCKKKIILESW